jgi:hypothetical protein
MKEFAATAAGRTTTTAYMNTLLFTLLENSSEVGHGRVLVLLALDHSSNSSSGGNSSASVTAATAATAAARKTTSAKENIFSVQRHCFEILQKSVTGESLSLSFLPLITEATAGAASTAAPAVTAPARKRTTANTKCHIINLYFSPRT